jgi:hypothetical protein
MSSSSEVERFWKKVEFWRNSSKEASPEINKLFNRKITFWIKSDKCEISQDFMIEKDAQVNYLRDAEINKMIAPPVPRRFLQVHSVSLWWPWLRQKVLQLSESDHLLKRRIEVKSLFFIFRSLQVNYKDIVHFQYRLLLSITT